MARLKFRTTNIALGEDEQTETILSRRVDKSVYLSTIKE